MSIGVHKFELAQDPAWRDAGYLDRRNKHDARMRRRVSGMLRDTILKNRVHLALGDDGTGIDDVLAEMDAAAAPYFAEGDDAGHEDIELLEAATRLIDQTLGQRAGEMPREMKLTGQRSLRN